MHKINILLEKIHSDQLEILSNDTTKIRLLVPTTDLLVITAKYHFNVKYSDFILIPANYEFTLKKKQPSKITNQNQIVAYILQIDAHFFDDRNWANYFTMQYPNVTRTTIPTVANFIDAFGFLLSENEYKRFGYEDVIIHLLNIICIHIERTYSNYSSRDIERQTQNEHDFFNSISLYINTHYRENLTNKSIANYFYISENKLKQLFQKYSQKSAHEMITSRRLISCKDLVLEGVPVTQAAKLVGYNDYSTFYRQFVNYFGQSPTKYFDSL